MPDNQMIELLCLLSCVSESGIDRGYIYKYNPRSNIAPLISSISNQIERSFQYNVFYMKYLILLVIMIVGRSTSLWLPFCRAQRVGVALRSTLSTTSSIDPNQYTYHVPVMRDECMDYLQIKEGGVYLDCTMGGGGHSRAILERGGRVIALDQDDDAIANTSKLLKSYIDEGKMEIHRVNFRHLKEVVLSKSNLAQGQPIDGVLMDLGISSYQIDEASRGFAFASDGPLDMRMQKDAELTAQTIVNTWEADVIANILYDYGDEVKSRSIAREIVASRPINTTSQLEQIISKRTSFKERSKTLARCFQALRIVVNDEINALEQALTDAQDVVKPTGRLVILSYHSLEDRRVKRLIRSGHIDAEDDQKTNSNQLLPWLAVNRRALPPSEAEIQLNRRARSAKLRAAERSSLGYEHMLKEQKEEATPDSTLGRKKKHLGLKQLRKLQSQNIVDNVNE